MKQWTSAEISGQCAFCGGTWKEAERIGLVQGATSTWTKRYCASCFRSHHGMGEDDGQITDITDHPSYPKPLKALAENALEKYSLRKAPDGFDGRAAALPRGDRDE